MQNSTFDMRNHAIQILSILDSHFIWCWNMEKLSWDYR